MNIESTFLTAHSMKNMKKIIGLLAAACLFPGAAALARAGDGHRHEAAALAPAAAAPASSGEVIKVDREAGKITLRHGPLDNLGMPGMTMAFRVAQPAILEQVEPGEKVRFVAELAGGALTIVTLQREN